MEREKILLEQSQSPWAQSWRKLKKNRWAIASMWFIGIISLIACLGYTISPDSSPFANNQHLEIALQKPGFSTTVLQIRKSTTASAAGFFGKMFNGEESTCKEVAISGFKIADGYITYREFSAYKGDEPTEHTLPLAAVVYPVADPTKVVVGRDQSTFTLTDGRKMTESNSTLEAKVRSGAIVEKKYALGTDRYGRDLLSRMIIGARVSLSVGIIAVAISLLIGITLGAASGYFRGWIDNLIMWFINVIWSVPTLLMVIAVTLVLGKGFWQIFIAVGLTMWVRLPVLFADRC